MIGREAKTEETMGLLDGKVGIITGAASGIGAATARILVREGARLVLTDIDDAAGSALAEEIGAHYLHLDVAEEDGWPAVIAAAERLGRLDIMVANAGIGIMGKAIDMSLKDWRRQMAINVDGVFLSAKYAIPAMRRAGNGGSIVMLSVGGRITWIGRPGRLQRNQGRGAAVRQVDGAGVRAGRRRHTGELGASRNHRHTDLDEDPGRPEPADRPLCRGRNDRAAGQGRRGIAGR